jgi:Calx-beta domain
MKGAWSCLASVAAALTLAASPAIASETISYSYDALGRLVATSTTGTAPTNGQSVSTTFDPAGNRTCYAVVINGSGTACAPGGGGTVPSVSIAAAAANEGTALSFPVTLSAAASGSVTVNYSTASGTAVAPTNFTATSGTLTIPAGNTSASIAVPTVNDGVVTVSLAMTLSLSAPSGASLGTASAAGTINNINVAGWTSALTAGTWSFCYPYPICTTLVGYYPALMGSMSNTAYNGLTVSGVFSSGAAVSFYLTGATAPPNSGWTSITVPGVGTLQRTAATYAVSGTQSYWTWTSSATVTSGTVTIQ